MSREQPPLVSVDWLDSHCSSHWETLEEMDEEIFTCRSVGYLVFQGDESTVIAPHVVLGEDGVHRHASGYMTIPTRSIVRIADLGESAVDRFTFRLMTAFGKIEKARAEIKNQSENSGRNFMERAVLAFAANILDAAMRSAREKPDSRAYDGGEPMRVAAGGQGGSQEQTKARPAYFFGCRGSSICYACLQEFEYELEGEYKLEGAAAVIAPDSYVWRGVPCTNPNCDATYTFEVRERAES